MRLRVATMVLLAACTGRVEGDPTDSGSSSLEDAGSVSADAGSGATDSGTAAVDASVTLDASVAVDSGYFYKVDAGPNFIDAGMVNNNPSWLAGHPLNEWFEIPNTAGSGGVNVDSYSGMGLRDSTSEIIIAAAGGHGDGWSNAVVSLMLASDTPQWLLRKGSSTDVPKDVGYYPDGLPSARHTYHSTHVIEPLGRVFLVGARYTWGSAYTFPYVDGFNLTTNQWDEMGTWASLPSGSGYGTVQVRATGDVYTSTFHKFAGADGTWSSPISGRVDVFVRFPIAHDSTRNELFTLQWGDGQGYDEDRGVEASKVALSGNSQVAITFNPSAALDQFIADRPTYSGMDYDPTNHRYLFYCGIGTGAGRIFVITPNDTTVWDMSILTLGPGSVTPMANGGSGVNNRFRYVPALKGFVLLAARPANLYFIKTE